MLRLILALLTLTAIAPSAQGQPAHTIPFELYDNRIYLEVSGPGFGPRWFMLDSGAQVTHYTGELVDEARLPRAGSVGISGTGTQRVRGAYVAPTVLRIGTLPLPVERGVSAPAEALFGSVFSGSGRRFDGVVGYDLFAAYVVQIDYGARQIRLYDPARYQPPPGAVRLPIRIVDRKPYLTATLRIAGAPVRANLHLDTGFGGVLSLNGNFVAAQGLLGRVGPTLTSWARGVGGITEARTARIEAVDLGPLTVARPITSLALAHGAGVRSDSSGRIGGELLRRYVATIDYRSRTLMLEPGPQAGEAFEIDMSGLSLLSDDQGPGFPVWRVAEASPAQAAGALAGDRVVAIDGSSVDGMTLEQVRAALRTDGVVRRLRLKRGTVELDVTFTLRRRL